MRRTSRFTLVLVTVMLTAFSAAKDGTWCIGRLLQQDMTGDGKADVLMSFESGDKAPTSFS